MKVDLVAIDRRADKAIIAFGKDPFDTAKNRQLVLLHRTSQSVQLVLQAPRGGIEGIADRDVNILMRMVLGRIARHHDLAFRHDQVNSHVVNVALTMVAVLRFDHDMTAGDLRMEPFKGRGAITRRSTAAEGGISRKVMRSGVSTGTRPMGG
jgi:hypothetical protein